LRVFGPPKQPPSSKEAKYFGKQLLRHGRRSPTADYQEFRNADHATTYLTEREDVPVVVKADGLAAGKGVFVCANRAEALEPLNASPAIASLATPQSARH